MDSVTPGNPAGIRELAGHWIQQGQAADDAAGTLRTAKNDIQGGTLRLRGDFAPKVQDGVGDLPDELAKLAKGYRGCGNALNTFAARLEEAQRKSRQAGTDWDTATRSKRNAEWDLDQLAPGWDAYADNPTGLRAYLAAKPEPVITAASRRESAVRDVGLADSLAQQAAQIRGEAETQCVRDINNALADSGLKNRSWFQKVGDYLKSSFTTWDGFVKLCENISVVLGVIAIFLTGPLALIVGAILLVTAIVAMADKINKFANGEIGWKELAFEAGMVLVARFGGRALGPAFRRLANTKTISALSKAARRGTDRLATKLKLGDTVRNLAHRGVCSVTGHPVDISTGKVFTEVTDLALPGPLPFAFERVWYSTSTYLGPLGHGWHHSYDAALYATPDALLYRTPDGRIVDLLPLYPDTQFYDREARLTLFRDAASEYRIRDSDGVTWRFAPLLTADKLPSTRVESANGTGTGVGADLDPERDPVVHVLRDVVSRSGHRISLSYDQLGRLSRIVDSGGRDIGFEHNDQGRFVALSAPHPDHDGERFTAARYAYDEAGNLVSMTDALGQVRRYEYDGHLLSRDTDRNGLSFYFEYDGSDERARCLHTWGDGGLYERRLSYAGALTTVTNSLGRTTQCEHQDGLVTRVVDAVGVESRTEYEYQQPVREIDGLGRVTSFEYDFRGNLRQWTSPDGSTAQVTFDEADLPVEAVDQVGGRWAWFYTEHGLVSERRDCLGRSTAYSYRSGLLDTLTDTAGGITTFGYDHQLSLTRLATPDGAVRSFDRNLLGEPIAVTDELGNRENRRLDLLGRIVSAALPDGNRRELMYDAEGSLLRVIDQQQDVEFRYQGVSQLLSRSQAGTTVRFEYDTEEQLTGIENEAGRLFRFAYGPTGQLSSERGFDDAVRMYERDPVGRPVMLRRASGLIDRYSYDDADRLVEIGHSDGSYQRFEYRLDGELTLAQNSTVTIRFERNLLGDVLRESRGEHWVESEFDQLGSRTSVRSSRGLEQVVQRDAAGSVTAVSAAGYSARFTRDALGQELERLLPGGVLNLSSRDRLGRLDRREVITANGTPHDRRYDWELDGRPLGWSDVSTGSTRLERDPLGRLTSATHGDGRTELRMPDAVGNLFRTQDRADRVYGGGGQLLESTDAQGRRVSHRYDADGNLVAKETSDGESWLYRWNADGTMREVVRPDGDVVGFGYDALGRRIKKSYDGRTTHWIWDGHTPLHEWVEHDGVEHGGTADHDVTWLFEPESFVPMARLAAGRQDSIVTDHLGTPVAMLDHDGAATWRCDLSIWGETDLSPADRELCPFRWAGQYEDVETGLYYNRFRYYDPASGQYTSQDPIGLLGGLGLLDYVLDPSRQTDPWGLNAIDLAANLTKDGRPLAAGQTAHHIVKENAKGYAAKSRDLLQRNGIHVDNSENGARLWGTHPSQQLQPGHPQTLGARTTGNYHGGVHIHGKANDKLIFRILSGAEKKGVPVKNVLEDIGSRMESGAWKATGMGGCYGSSK